MGFSFGKAGSFLIASPQELGLISGITKRVWLLVRSLIVSALGTDEKLEGV
jgi:hypothetical protein